MNEAQVVEVTLSYGSLPAKHLSSMRILSLPRLPPVNPSVQYVRLWLRTGRTADCGGCPGRTAVVASVLMLAEKT